jgi:hypothetical protein
VNVGAEGPDGGPDAPAGGELGADLDVAVKPVGLVVGLERGGGVVGDAGRAFDGVGVLFLAGLDDEMAVLDAGVFQAPGSVELGLVIADEAFLVDPLGGIGQAVGIVLEFVGPDEGVGRRRGTGNASWLGWGEGRSARATVMDRRDTGYFGRKVFMAASKKGA